jgi:hypothetical protein
MPIQATLANYSEMEYFLELINNPENQILITGRTGSIYGFVDGETAFSTTAQYSNEAAGSGIAEAVADATNSATNIITNGSEQRVKPQRLTRVTWQDSTLNALSFDIYLPTYHRDVNVMDQAMLVFDFTLPEATGLGQVYTPNRYELNYLGRQQNLLSVRIGNWFESINSWVCTNGSFVVSKEKIMDTYPSKPLYIKISVTLTPGSQFRAAEVKNWFRI